MLKGDDQYSQDPASLVAAASPEGQNPLEKLPLNQVLQTLFHDLCRLNTTDGKTRKLYEDIASAAAKYQKENIKAMRYVSGVERFASDTVMTFEGFKDGRYTQEEAFEEFREDVEDSKKDLLEPLENVERALEALLDEVNNLLKESGLLAGEYQTAGRRWEYMKDVAADINKNPVAATTVVVSLSELLALSCSATAVAVFSVISQACATWGAIEQRKMKENAERFRELNNDLTKVSQIMGVQRSLLQILSDMAGPDMSRKQKRAEGRLESGKSTSLPADKIIKLAKELEDKCKTFQRDHSV